ncbi:MAG: hypothetical protein AAGJ79_12855 [Verrucomicrobiota bacterium]
MPPTVQRQQLMTAVWIVGPFLTFALGWWMNPGRSDPTKEPMANAGDGSASTVSALSSDRSRSAPADEDGKKTGRGFLDGFHFELTDGKIKELGETFRESLDPIEKRLAFSDLLRGLTPGNAEAVRRQIEHLPQNSPEFQEFHYAWGKVAGNDAVMFGAETEKADMAPALSGWASADPEAALDWFRSLDMENDSAFDNLLKDRGLDPNELRHHFAEGIVKGLSAVDAEAATEFVYSLPDPDMQRSRGMLRTVTESVMRSRTSAEAAAWAAALPADADGDNTLRQTALARVAGQFAWSEPELAVDWVGELPLADQTEGVLHTLGGKLGAREGENAAAWSTSLNPASPGREAAIHASFEGWTHTNPGAVTEYLSGMTSSPDRDLAISGFVSRYRWENPEATIVWADQITNATTREQALVQAGRAYMKQNPDDGAAWLAASELSNEAKLRVVSPAKRRDRS